MSTINSNEKRKVDVLFKKQHDKKVVLLN